MSKNEFFSIYINLLKAVMGAGLLAYPFYIKEYGMQSLILLSALACFFSSAGLIFYALSNIKIGKKSTMASITNHIYPRLKPFVSFSISVKCFWVSVLYLKIIDELIASQVSFLSKRFPRITFSHRTIRLITFLIISPFAYIEKITKLKFISFIGIIAVFTVLISNSITFIRSNNEININWKGNDKIFYTRLGDIVYGFTCHQNIFSVQNEMKNKSLLFLMKIIAATMITSFSIYLYFGYINYKIYGSLVEQTILTNYGKRMDVQSFLVIVLFSLMLLISIPLQVHPCRIYALSLFNDKLIKSKNARIVATTIILFGIYIFGISELINIRRMYIYIGGTVSSFICFVFGSIYYLKLFGYKGITGMCAIMTLFFGLYVFSGFVFQILRNMAE